MGKLQLNKDLSDEQVKAIVAFLHTLKANIPAEMYAEPVMPN